MILIKTADKTSQQKTDNQCIIQFKRWA